MSGTYNFAVLGVADRRRNEKLNAALIVFGDEHVDVRVPRRLDRLRALSAALDLDALRDDIFSLSSIDALARQSGLVETCSRIDYLMKFTQFDVSEPGSFEAHDANAYEIALLGLQKLLLEPEPAPIKRHAKRTRLTTSVKQALRKERILAKKGEGLDAHRVMANVAIAEGLDADFVLKNGAMHVVETVDASSDEVSLKKVVGDIAVSALVLEHARMTFGEAATKARLVYDASSSIERIAQPSLMAAQHQGTELINWASADDRRKFLVHMATLAEPLPTKREARMALHASTQHKFQLN